MRSHCAEDDHDPDRDVVGQVAEKGYDRRDTFKDPQRIPKTPGRVRPQSKKSEKQQSAADKHRVEPLRPTSESLDTAFGIGDDDFRKILRQFDVVGLQR